MTHRDITRALNIDLDDLKVRNPSRYQQLERRLKLLQAEAGFAIAQSPPGVKSMERMTLPKGVRSMERR